MHRARVLIGLVVALGSAPWPAAGQRIVLSYSIPDGGSTLTRSIDLTTGAVEWTEPAPLSSPPVFTADGQFVLYRRADTPTGPLSLVLRNTTSGQAMPLPLDFEPRVALPRQLAVLGFAGLHSTGFGTTAGSLARLDGTGLRLGGGCPPGTTVEFDLSLEGDTVAALCQSGDLVLLDAAAGQVLRTVAADPLKPISSLRLIQGGQVLVVRRGTSAHNEIAVVDTASGATVAATAVDPAEAGCRLLAIAADKTRAAVGCMYAAPPFSILGWTRVVDTGTLTLGPAMGQLPLHAAFSPDGRDVFVGSHHRLGFGSLNRHDVATGAITLSSGVIEPGHFALSFAPLAPTFSATVSGRQVDLQWALPAHSPAAQRYVLEIGSASGLTDIGSIAAGPAPALTVPAAPPGRYYVRVRGVNAAGAGAASPELVIDVP